MRPTRPVHAIDVRTVFQKGNDMQHQSNDSKSETVMLAHVPNWIEDRFGFRVNRSTVFRWKTRGCRGKRLNTFRVGGRVCTICRSLAEILRG